MSNQKTLFKGVRALLVAVLVLALLFALSGCVFLPDDLGDYIPEDVKGDLFPGGIPGGTPDNGNENPDNGNETPDNGNENPDNGGKEDNTQVVLQGSLQIHFLELGNKYTGDCTYIKAGETDILIDAGSRTSSIATISSYINNYVTDGKLEYVIVTHAHRDHYAGFSKRDGSLFDLYEVGTIIDFALTNQEDKGSSNMYGRYLLERNDEIAAGATHYTAADCIEQGRSVFALDHGITMTVLDSYYYYNSASRENDYSVCTLFTYGTYHYLFTGDLEEEGEEHLVQMNNLPEVDLYKAGHHGSKTSSSSALLEVIRPDIVCVCCCAGSSEHTDTNENQFPTQQFIDRVAPYTDRVYVTTRSVDYSAGTFASMNGNITVVTDQNGIKVVCGSGDERVLKEWEWFAENRTLPDAWK